MKRQSKPEASFTPCVSSQQQRAAGDLHRQLDDLKCRYPTYDVITDVGSGLNFRRPGLQRLLERVHSGMVTEVVVRHKDRLCRYGLELVEFLLQKSGTRLVVQSGEPVSCTQELADDLLAITTVFVARHNGQRSAENRRRRKVGKGTDDGKESASLPEQAAGGEAQEVGRHCPMDVQQYRGCSPSWCEQAGYQQKESESELHQ